MGFSMAHTLQIAMLFASADCCSLREAIAEPALQNARMANESKNGGPNYVGAWREHRGKTQEQLADDIKTTAPVISLLESGDRGLNAKWLRKLSKALNATPTDLLERDPKQEPPFVSQVLSIAERIRADDRKRVLSVLQGFTDHEEATGA